MAVGISLLSLPVLMALRRLTREQRAFLRLGTLDPPPNAGESPAEARARAWSGFCYVCQLEGVPIPEVEA
jgi:hypothetical protein